MAKKRTTKKTETCVKECSADCRLLEEIRLIAINSLPTSGQGKDAFKDIIGKIEEHLQEIATK